MGKSKRKVRPERHRPNTWRQDDPEGQEAASKKPAWTDDIPRTNAVFEKFYQALAITKSAQEWDEFLDTCKRSLPLSFRLTGCRQEVQKLKNVLQDKYFSTLAHLTEIDGHRVESPTEMSCFPDAVVYQMALPRKVMRKSALLNSLHNFLVTEGEVGNLSRQETVSMIPPMLLDVRSDSRILDMCAAPGSKTAQMLELMYRDTPPGQVPAGYIVANDSDNKRCYLLVHQALRRMQTPNIVITNQDAGAFPHIFTRTSDGRRESIYYDRILCDVPCSGDGTLRKNVEIWKKWNPQTGYALHKLQCRIAKRAVELLEPGGLMVYSTCSLNPAENEAVLVNILENAENCVELVDVSAQLQGLKRLPGLLSWEIISKRGDLFAAHDQLPQGLKSQMPKEIFPPSLERSKELKLDRAFRILPHYQDTGGFFVAVLRKTALLPSQAKAETKKQEKSQKLISEETSANGAVVEAANGSDENGSGGESPRAKLAKVDGDLVGASSEAKSGGKKKGFTRGRIYREDPFIFLREDEPLWPPLKEYFGICSEFPYLQLLGRCEEDASKSKRNLYFVNQALREILVANDPERLKVINAGVRVFKRVEQKLGGFRLAQESASFLLPYLTKRVFPVSTDDMISLLKGGQACLLENFSEDLQSKLEQCAMGSIVMYAWQDGHQYVVCGWKGEKSVAPYLAKELRIHLLRMFDVDTSDMERDLMSNRKQKTMEEGPDIPLEETPNIPENETKKSEDGHGAVVEVEKVQG